ncbi:uncharacterized protein UV8b_05282 [Ustilaginoidea virens]|uniref:Uncharacterized protein n=1 Tax=Ustilaginoidea virens TaxID=1159556 RepID=A0A8E5HT34_USTVR|nr:uncharacterized protein UV8b_05282 [Ustilaginoidea virens]QUC21041.1 hypothetical protein UV8b_05282 [Ustilaginoidea virens]
MPEPSVRQPGNGVSVHPACSPLHFLPSHRFAGQYGVGQQMPQTLLCCPFKAPPCGPRRYIFKRRLSGWPTSSSPTKPEFPAAAARQQGRISELYLHPNTVAINKPGPSTPDERRQID